MKLTKGLTALVFLLAFVSMSVLSCNRLSVSTDIIGRTAVSTFRALTEKNPDLVKRASDGDTWYLASPSGEYVLLGSVSGLELDSAPFIEAGLDPERLAAFDTAGTETGGILYRMEGSRLAILAGADFPPRSAAEGGIVGALSDIVANSPERIGYHQDLDHYGIAFGGGNMFEWARDTSANDKDMVFVIEGVPLIAAGLDVTRLGGGWLYADVKVSDASGKMVMVKKLLKPFDLP